MRKWFIGLLALVGSALLSAGAYAQGASCSISASIPVVSAATTYAITPADACKLLIFTSGSAVTVTGPNPATTLPPGYSVSIKSQGTGTVTFTTTGGTLDGLSSGIAWTTGTGGEIRTDGTNYFSCCLGIKKP